MSDTTQDALAPTGEPDWKANAMSLSAAMDRQAEYHELEKRQLLQRLDAAHALAERLKADVCCGEFATCRERCIPLVDHLRALLAKGAPEPDAPPAAPAVPEGWRLVPVEPTPGMWNEVLRGMNEADAEHWKRSMTITWRLLIAAAYKEQSK
jgi:hypothetical protein